MMNKIVGNRMGFGIEYEIYSRDPYVMGGMRLWIEGKYVGAFDDVNILSAILYQFDGLNDRNIDGCDFLDKSVDEIYEIIDSDDVSDGRRFLFSPGESFDDFVIYVYICDCVMYFLWKLVDDPFFEYPDYPKGVQSAHVCVGEFCRVVAQFKAVVFG